MRRHNNMQCPSFVAFSKQECSFCHVEPKMTVLWMQQSQNSLKHLPPKLF